MTARPGERHHNLPREHLADKAKFVRLETLRLAKICGAGHYSASFSAAELFAALYYAHLRFDPKDPQWPDRDRFILSKGHAAIGLYPVLADLGFYPPSLLDNFTKLGSAFGDHPNMKTIPGIDFSSGSLGHGLSVGVGIALAGRIQKRQFRTYCMLGDGEIAEGQIWEAAMSANQFKLQGLVAIVDRNQLCIDGHTEEIMAIEPLGERFAAFGWDVQRIDGHDIEAILGALGRLKPAGVGRPQVIIADTIKGRGVKRMELSLQWHVANLVGEDYEDAVAEVQAGLKPYEAKAN
jgi:transketolase